MTEIKALPVVLVKPTIILRNGSQWIFGMPTYPSEHPGFLRPVEYISKAGLHFTMPPSYGDTKFNVYQLIEYIEVLNDSGGNLQHIYPVVLQDQLGNMQYSGLNFTIDLPGLLITQGIKLDGLRCTIRVHLKQNINVSTLQLEVQPCAGTPKSLFQYQQYPTQCYYTEAKSVDSLGYCEVELMGVIGKILKIAVFIGDAGDGYNAAPMTKTVEYRGERVETGTTKLQVRVDKAVPKADKYQIMVIPYMTVWGCIEGRSVKYLGQEKPVS